MKLETSLGMHFYSIQNETCQKKRCNNRQKAWPMEHLSCQRKQNHTCCKSSQEDSERIWKGYLIDINWPDLTWIICLVRRVRKVASESKTDSEPWSSWRMASDHHLRLRHSANICQCITWHVGGMRGIWNVLTCSSLRSGKAVLRQELQNPNRFFIFVLFLSREQNACRHSERSANCTGSPLHQAASLNLCMYTLIPSGSHIIPYGISSQCSHCVAFVLEVGTYCSQFTSITSLEAKLLDCELNKTRCWQRVQWEIFEEFSLTFRNPKDLRCRKIIFAHSERAGTKRSRIFIAIAANSANFGEGIHSERAFVRKIHREIIFFW